MSKADKLKAIKQALQPKQPKMDKIYIHSADGIHKLHSEVMGSGKIVIVSSFESVDILEKLNAKE